MCLWKLLKMVMAYETLREQTTMRMLTSLEWRLGDMPLCVGVHVGTTWRWHIKATNWNPMHGESPSRWQDVTKGTTRGCFKVRWNPSGNPMCGKSHSRWQEVTKGAKNGRFKVRWNPIVSSQSNSPQGDLVFAQGWNV